jgi:hypothetical protein
MKVERLSWQEGFLRYLLKVVWVLSISHMISRCQLPYFLQVVRALSLLNPPMQASVHCTNL